MEKRFAAVVLSVSDLFLGRKTLQFSKTPLFRYFKAYRYQTSTEKVYDFPLFIYPLPKKQLISKVAALRTLHRPPCDPITYNLFPINPAGFTPTYCISSPFRKSDPPQGILLDMQSSTEISGDLFKDMHAESICYSTFTQYPA